MTRAGPADEVSALCDALGDESWAEEEAAEQFASWRAGRDERAADLLDVLAGRADEPASLALLLRLVDQHRLARSGVRRFLIDEHDVADAEQAALAVVALKAAQFQGRARFTTWLHQIAANEARMLIRSRDRHGATPVAEPPDTVFWARLSTLVAEREAIEQAIADLPDLHREVFVLRERDGLEYDEIARALDVPVGTVRSRLSRARAALVHALDR